MKRQNPRCPPDSVGFGIFVIVGSLDQSPDLGGNIFRGEAVLLKEHGGSAGLAELVLNANAVKFCAALACNDLCHCRTKAARDEMLLCRDDSAYLAVVAENTLLIQRP